MKIHLPAETWEEVLNWLNRREFARKMEQLWDREFTPIAEKWLHEWSRNNGIGQLEFKKDEDANQAELRTISPLRGQVPIAEVPMPKNIRSFEYIRISYLDNTVLAFLRKMQPLFRNVHLSIDGSDEGKLQIALDHLLPLLSGDEFKAIGFRRKAIQLLNNNARYASALLNTKLLFIGFFEFPWCFELLANWLFTKRADGEPRMLAISLYTGAETFISDVQKRFMAASTDEQQEAFPSFIIRFDSVFKQFEERTIENVSSGQQLIVRRISNPDWRYFNMEPETYVLVISCPLDMSKEDVDKWERKVLDWRSSRRIIQLYSPSFGPLDAIDQKQLQQSGSSSSEEANAAGKPAETSSNM